MDHGQNGSSGVLQGSVLGLLLPSVLINDLDAMECTAQGSWGGREISFIGGF